MYHKRKSINSSVMAYNCTILDNELAKEGNYVFSHDKNEFMPFTKGRLLKFLINYEYIYSFTDASKTCVQVNELKSGVINIKIYYH